MRVVGVAEWEKYLNKHKKWVKSTGNDNRTYTNSITFEPFGGSDDVFEFEHIEGQISSTSRTHIFTLT